MADEGSRVLFQGSSGAWYAISPALAVKVARNDSTSSESETLEKLAAQWPSAEGKYEGLGPYEQLRVLQPIMFGTIADLQRIYQFGFTQMMSRNASAFVTERLYPVPGETDFTLVELGQVQNRAKLASFGMDLEAVCYELGRFLGFVQLQMDYDGEGLQVLAVGDPWGLPQLVIFDVGRFGDAGSDDEMAEVVRSNGPFDEPELLDMYFRGFMAGGDYHAACGRILLLASE